MKDRRKERTGRKGEKRMWKERRRCGGDPERRRGCGDEGPRFSGTGGGCEGLFETLTTQFYTNHNEVGYLYDFLLLSHLFFLVNVDEGQLGER